MKKQPTLLMMETNIDDMNPQLYEPLLERLFKAGARDVHLIPCQMKKNRPGILVRILCDSAKKEKMAEILFRESTTLGVRSFKVERDELEREIIKVKTPYGSVPVKVGRLSGEIVNVWPEYEDCRKLAKRKKVPLKVLYQSIWKHIP